ncbi:ATP-dependent RNA helicase DHX36 [Cytospora mali]|uniref:ATP-dependent RNA helicase DHX36 n=1 Tax=Cytospora mali TaxID=578113 RepID=A0A194VHV5_CYTMA|nr:ATP-dependent RNA helicase DHX36 [Valsa mali]
MDMFQLESLSEKTIKRKQPAQKGKQSQKGKQGKQGKQTQNSNRSRGRKEATEPVSTSLSPPTPIPTDEELPEWAQTAERNQSNNLYEKVRLSFVSQILGGSFKADFTPNKGKTSLYECTILAKAGDQEWKAVAEARTRVHARENALLILLAQITAQGLEGDLFPVARSMSNYMEKHAKKHQLLDVFNYAASLDTVPSVTCAPAERLSPGYHQYTISLPKQDIRVTAVSKSRSQAETAACVKFKKAAGKYVASSDVGDDLTSQGSDRLSSANAAKFLGWLANRHRLSSSTNVYPDQPERRSSLWFAQVSYKSAGEQRTTPTIPSFSKVYAEGAATIHAAVSAAQDEPALFQQFIEELIGGKGHLLEITRPIDLEISAPSQYAIRTTLGIHGLPQLAQELQDNENSQQPQIFRNRVLTLTEEQKRLLSPRLKSSYERYLQSDKMADMRKLKSELPMNQYKSQVSDLVQNNVYSIIIGATGSGKTTQVPQIILEKYYQEGRGADCNIICTQPRRIAATSVAGRVADEMGPDLRDRVGYQVRFDSRPPAQGGSVTYCTTGILLQQLQYEPDRVFDAVSHLMIDEVHERDKIIDFTLTVLKRAVTDRLARGLKVPRITLMSATLDTELFAGYFKNLDNDGQPTRAPVLSVPGRTFPVSEKHLGDVLAEIQGMWPGNELGLLRNDRNTTKYIEMEDSFAGTHMNRPLPPKQDTDIISAIDWKPKPVYDDASASAKEDTILPAGLIATTIGHVLRTTTDGAVLVFFPGLTEIQAIEKILRTQSVLGVNVSDETKYKLFLLHSSIPDSQRTVFEKPSPGIRKVILSTNIAETSVTIPDVQYVIDTGKVRQIQYDNSTRVSWLQNSWISKSNAKQRAGRAGRVQNGHYLALYSKARHESMSAIGVPELLRSDLQSTCLAVKATIRGVGVADFLADAIDPPNPVSVKEAMTRLVDLGALTPDHANLTALGNLLASLPVHPALGKMIVLGIMFKCLDPVLVIGAAAEERGLFVMAPDVKSSSLRSKADFAGETGSDHLAIYNAFCHVREYYSPDNDSHARRVAQSAYIHFGAWKAIHRASQQIQDILQETGVLRQDEIYSRDNMIGDRAWNINSHKPHIIKAILLAGLQPNIGLKKRPSHRLVILGDRPAAEPSNFSVLRANRTSWTENSLVAFTNVAKSTDGRSFSLRELSIVQPLAVALFGGTFVPNGPIDRSNIFTVNKWLQLYVSGGSAPSRRSGLNIQAQIYALRQNMDRVLKVAFEDLIKGQMRGANTTPNYPGGRHHPTRASTLLTASEKASIVSDFLLGVVKVLDGAESPAAEGRGVDYLSDENGNFPSSGLEDRIPMVEVPEMPPASTKEEVPEMLPASTKEEVPEMPPASTKEEVPEMPPASTKEEVPEMLPDSTKEEVPEMLPASTKEDGPEATLFEGEKGAKCHGQVCDR